MITFLKNLRDNKAFGFLLNLKAFFKALVFILLIVLLIIMKIIMSQQEKDEALKTLKDDLRQLETKLALTKADIVNTKKKIAIIGKENEKE